MLLLSISDIYKEGTPLEASLIPIMNLFSVPKDNILMLHSLHFETSKLLKDNNNNVTYTHSINPSFNIKYILSKRE